MSFYFLFHKIKFKRLFILFSPLLIYFIWVLLLIFFDINSAMDNESVLKNAITILGGLVAGIIKEFILPFMIIIYVLKYIKNRDRSKICVK